MSTTLKCKDIASVIERLAPKQLAYNWDNVGLLCGDEDAHVTKVLLTLDLDIDVVEEAVKEGAQMIIGHHPIMFDPINCITAQTSEGRLLRALIKNDISYYAAHTNLDIAKGGLNDLLAKKADEFAKVAAADQADWIAKNLTAASASAFTSLPAAIKAQLCMDRDPHGNVQVSRIETEKLLIEMVGAKLETLKAEGKYKGKFAGLNHFFGYEGRCAAPSNFDADYCYSLGYVAFLLIASGLTGYMSSVKNLAKPATEWVPGGIPTSMMFNMEQRHGEKKPVIRKALVELEGAPYKEYVKYRNEWAENTSYLFPGAIQYYGPAEVCDAPTKTLTLESK